MNEINTQAWGEFNLKDLFDFSMPKGDLQTKKVVDGNTLLITPSNFNNGVFKRIKDDSESTLYNPNTITVDMFGNAYYHTEKYFVVAHGHVNVLIPKFKLTEKIALFLTSIMRSTFYQKYAFTTMCTQTAIKKERIKLPITPYNTPDWHYMETYIQKIQDKATKVIDIFETYKPQPKQIDTVKWGEFSLKELFGNPARGTRLTQANRIEGNIPLITAGFDNQGIASFITNNHNVIYKDKLTIDMFGNCFYRNYSFAADDNILIFGKDNISENIYLYLASTINAAINSKYNYKEQFRLRAYNTTNIKLPIKSNNTPDWEYMENYIKAIKTKAQNNIDILKYIA